MLIWLLLFLTIVVISFVLALRSMGDFYEKPAKSAADFAPFLVRRPGAVTVDLLDDLYEAARQEGLLLAFERLFKGKRRALVIFGSRQMLQPFSEVLELLELEDYSLRVDNKNVSPKVRAWEMGVKQNTKSSGTKTRQWLESEEEFWWELVVQPIGLIEEKTKQALALLVGRSTAGFSRPQDLKQAAVNMETDSAGRKRFQMAMRSVVLGSDKKRADLLQSELVGVGGGLGLTPLPQPHATDTLIKLYQERALPQFGEDGTPVGITTKELYVLLTLGIRPWDSRK